MKSVSCLCGLAVLGVGVALAGPSLPVTKPPVQPVPSWSGPPVDPHAVSGQWFVNPAGIETYRTHEFYDNVRGFGGGFAGSNAIDGWVSALFFDPFGNIAAFDITATITNDDGPEGPWEPGSNSHGEFLPPDVAPSYSGTLFDTKLTASFADDGVLGNFPGPFPPYFGDEYSQNIYAMNYDELAWYCWTPVNPDDLRPWGSYMVPTWDFGNIPLNGSVTRVLNFGLYVPLEFGDPLYGFLMDAHQTQADVLLNRTTSLKISDYFDALSFDPGVPYPLPPSLSSDVSVFHNIPEPASLIALALGALAVLRRR